MPRNISTLHFEQVGRSSMLGLIGITAWVDTSPAIFPSVRFPTNAALGFVVTGLSLRYECGANRRDGQPYRAVVSSGYVDRGATHPHCQKIQCESRKPNGRFRL